MLRITIIACIVVTVYPAKQVTFKDCGSHGAQITAIYSNDCTNEPCTVHRGQNYTGTVEFKATKTSTSANVILHGGLGILSVPWPVTPADACQTSMSCPLEAGKSYTYPINMHCPSIAPQSYHWVETYPGYCYTMSCILTQRWKNESNEGKNNSQVGVEG